MVEEELCYKGVLDGLSLRMFEIFTIWPVVSLSDTGRFYCITLLLGGLKLANLVWLKNFGRWFV